jgi:hypothetical protein
MTARHVRAFQLAIAALAVVLAAAWTAPPAGADEAATYHECYRSIRSCQKSRCGQASGTDQVSCIRQCNREYETCVSGAGGGGGDLGSVLGIPEKLSTPTTKRERKRDMRRQQQ